MQRSGGEAYDIIRHHPSFMLIPVYRVVFAETICRSRTILQMCGAAIGAGDAVDDRRAWRLWRIRSRAEAMAE